MLWFEPKDDLEPAVLLNSAYLKMPVAITEPSYESAGTLCNPNQVNVAVVIYICGNQFTAIMFTRIKRH